MSRSLSALRDVEISQDVVLMVEAHEETTYVRHHPQKIALVLSAMRHFAESLRAEGLRVDYVRLDDAGHSGSFTGELGRALSRHPADRVLYADGGLLGSKPYVASGAYIHRLSDYCTGCAYDPKIKRGPKACPFNYLYWHFSIVNETRLKPNPRMALPYRTLAGMTADHRRAIGQEAMAFLNGLDRPSP